MIRDCGLAMKNPAVDGMKWVLLFGRMKVDFLSLPPAAFMRYC